MKKLSVYFFVLFIFNSAHISAQTEMWVKLSPEIRMNIQKTPFEIRWRPVDITYLPSEYVSTGQSGRTDLMLGVNFSKFKLFSYSKFGENGEIWTGARLDFNFDLFDKKILINIQERYFWGLNDKSKTHYYLVNYIRYNASDIFNPGILCYGKWNVGREFNTGNWFMGPSMDVKFAKGFNLLLALTKDVFHTKTNMTFVRFGYSFKVNNDKTE